MNRIAICMSTYNGEAHLEEQIESILCQTHRNLCLFIRDDGSSDNTMTIIRKYADAYDNVLCVNDLEHNNNLGVKKSFLTILNYAVSNNSYDYFAFADQDDVWLSDKVKRAIETLEAVTPSRCGKLYYSNKTIVDSQLNVIREEKIRFYDDYLECLFTSLAYGCTMVFDRTFADILCRHLPKCSCYHDSWAYRLAKTIGTTIIFDTKSYILYRQHTNNELGIAELHDTWWYLRKLYMLISFGENHYIYDQIEEIAMVFPDEIKESEYRDTVDDVLNYPRSIKNKLKLMRIKGIRKRGFKERLAWYRKILYRQL